jgi:porphobilinogen synthase
MDHVLNPESTDALAQMALAAAQAGADCVAPSDMMDGRIRVIREILDNNNCAQTVIMSYSAKFASAFYGPFRIAQNSGPDQNMKLQDRKTYQMDYRRPDDALACSVRDAQEGADILMVKPVVHYLDVLKTLTEQINLPFAAYYVSGEHALVEAAASQGLVNAQAAHIENWHGIARAGGQIIITYAARYARKWLGEFYGE